MDRLGVYVHVCMRTCTFADVMYMWRYLHAEMSRDVQMFACMYIEPCMCVRL